MDADSSSADELTKKVFENDSGDEISKAQELAEVAIQKQQKTVHLKADGRVSSSAGSQNNPIVIDSNPTLTNKSTPSGDIIGAVIA